MIMSWATVQSAHPEDVTKPYGALDDAHTQAEYPKIPGAPTMALQFHQGTQRIPWGFGISRTLM